MNQGHIMSDEKTLIIYCNSLFMTALSNRMQPAMTEFGWSIVLVTSLLSVYLRAHRYGIPCYLIKAGEPKHSYQGLEANKTREYLQRTSRIQHIQFFQNSTLSSLEFLISRIRPSAVAVWNGMDAGTQATLAFANHHGIPKILFEIGNIDSKLFADPEGVNASSMLVRNPSALDAWRISDEEFADWLTKFKGRQLLTTIPPQARFIRSINPFYLLDRAGATLLGTPQPTETTIVDKLVNKFKNYRVPTIHAIRPISPYVFLPLQVSSDINLLIHSDYDNLSAIDIAAKHARKLGCILVVKMHPAETDRTMALNILRACQKHGHFITSMNTTELVLGAVEVVTINSTVGLEAMLLGKKVMILGRCIYKDFTTSRTRAYVLRYLVDFDPFGEKPMSLAAFSQIIGHLEAGINTPHQTI